MSDLEHMIDVMTETPQAVTAAMIVANTNSALKLRLVSLLHEQFRKLVDDKGWTLDWSVSAAKWAHITVDSDERSPVVFRFQFDKSNFNELAVGLVKKNLSKAADATLRSGILEKIGDGEGSTAADEEWLWWRWVMPENDLCPLAKDWGTNVEIWAAIADGSAGRTMFSAAEKLITATAQSLSSVGGNVPT